MRPNGPTSCHCAVGDGCGRWLRDSEDRRAPPLPDRGEPWARGAGGRGREYEREGRSCPESGAIGIIYDFDDDDDDDDDMMLLMPMMMLMLITMWMMNVHLCLLQACTHPAPPGTATAWLGATPGLNLLPNP
ncbi:hypothetical protein N9L68_07300 [bacterium]|nr:hypothetical protein [bacterium]